MALELNIKAVVSVIQKTTQPIRIQRGTNCSKDAEWACFPALSVGKDLETTDPLRSISLDF